MRGESASDSPQSHHHSECEFRGPICGLVMSRERAHSIARGGAVLRSSATRLPCRGIPAGRIPAANSTATAGTRIWLQATRAEAVLVHMYACVCVCLSVCLAVCLSVCLFLSPSLSLSLTHSLTHTHTHTHTLACSRARALSLCMRVLYTAASAGAAAAAAAGISLYPYVYLSVSLSI